MTKHAGAHKQRTHKRILDAAARAFRTEGVAGVAIPRLMGEAGLTHGGFYAHFESKDALVAEACEQGLSEMAAQLLADAQQAPQGEGLQAIIKAYVSRQHRDMPETGCMIPALAAEIAREPIEVRHAFTQSLHTLFAHIAPFLPDRQGSTHDEEAMVLMAGMAGTILLSRAVDDPTLSDRILKASRDFYLKAFAARDEDHAPSNCPTEVAERKS